MGRPNWMAALDGRNELLVAFHVRDTVLGPLYGRRFDQAGRPLEIASVLLSAADPYAQVVGLPEGWLVISRGTETGSLPH
ncbi:MAG: hypothetical protein R3B99_31590 [Polyangiales bacterium]